MKDEIAARLRAIRGRTEAATDGPWVVEGGNWSYSIYPQASPLPSGDSLLAYVGKSMFQPDSNASFIAAARDDVPYLLGVADAAAAFLGLFLADEGCGVDTCEAALTLLRAFGGETEGDGE